MSSKLFHKNNKLFHINIIVCIILFLCKYSLAQTILSGFVPPGHSGDTQTMSLAGYGPNDLISILFETSNNTLLTTTSLIVNFDGLKQPQDYPIQQFYHKNPSQINNYDLDAMWNARKQYINIRRPPSAANLFMTIINFDPSYRQANISYNITIRGPGQIANLCSPCPNGQNYGGGLGGCNCQNCLFQNIGQICSRFIQNLDKNKSITLSPQVYQYFTISNTDQITVDINVQGGVAQAYFQFQKFDGEVASFYNVASGTNSDGRYLISSNDLQVQAQTQQRKLLITIVSFSNYAISASISYVQTSSVSVLVIVMGVLGGILLLALIIAVVCIIKRRNNSTRVNSQLNLPSDTSKLSGQQIQRYFPPCIHSQLGLYTPLNQNFESSINQLSTNNQAQKQGGTDQDCVICLQQINQTDQIRIGYCKHMFHGNCLISWFKKQRNCPYCRKQYNRDQTVAQYNKLVEENGNRVLKNNQLVKAIYHRKIVSKTVIQNLQ